MLHKQSYIKSAIFQLMVVSAIFIVNSQSKSETEIIDELSLGDLLTMEISSGSFLELDLKKSPFSMTIITEEMIRTSGARNMSELLEIFVPGFQYMYNKWDGTLWGMRGISNDRNTKLIYLINGHKMNTQARDGFKGEVVLGLLNDIKQIEVLRGPAGVIYGSGAIAGIINVVTKKNDNKSTNVNMGYATPDSKEFEVNIFGSLSDRQNISFSAGYRKSNGVGLRNSRLYGNQSWPFPSLTDELSFKNGIPSDGSYGSTDGNMKAACDWKIENFNLYFRATRQKENAGGWFPVDPWPEYYNPTIDSSAGNRTVDDKSVSPTDSFWFSTESMGENRRQYISDNISAEGSYNFPINENALKLKCGYDINTTRIGTEQRRGYLDIDSLRPCDLIVETFGEKRLTFNAMYLLKSVDRLQFAAGLEYRLDMIGNDMQGKNEKNQNPRHKVVSNVNYQTLSLFTESFYDITGKLGLDLGGRLDFHTRAFMANPKIALVFQPWQNQSFKLIYQTSSNNGSADNYEYNRNQFDPFTGEFRTEPSFERPQFTPDNQTAVIPAAPAIEDLHSLKPEKVRSIEFASANSIGDFLTLMPSVALGQVTNLFGWSQALYRVVNAGQYNYFNMDIDCKFDSKFVEFGGSHTYQRPIFTDVNSQGKTFVLPMYDESGSDWYRYDTAQGRYIPVSNGKYDTVTVNLVRDAVTADGRNFLNLSTNVTKLYLIVKPTPWIAFHTNLRLFWGLNGRKSVYDQDEKKGYQCWDIQNGSFSDYLHGVPKKLNAGLSFFIHDDITISIFAYDILGINRHDGTWKNDRYIINTIRWQQMAEPEQEDLASTDLQSFGFKISKGF